MRSSAGSRAGASASSPATSTTSSSTRPSTPTSATRTARGSSSVTTTSPTRSASACRSTTTRPSRSSPTTTTATCCAASTARAARPRSTTTSGRPSRRCAWKTSSSPARPGPDRRDHQEVPRRDREDGRRGRHPRPDDEAHRRQDPRGRQHRRARPGRRALHPLPGGRAVLQGLPRVPRVDLRLAQRDGRPRHPGSLPPRQGRRDQHRHRRHPRRVGRRRCGHVRRRRGRPPWPPSCWRSRAARCSMAVEQCRPGNRLGDVSHAVQQIVEADGLSVVRSLVGHGIGRSMHEEPQIPNYGEPGKGPLLEEGMVLAVEPMTTAGRHMVRMGGRRLGDLLPGRVAWPPTSSSRSRSPPTGRGSSRPGTRATTPS